MRQRRRLGLALSSAAATGVACLAIATPALATDPAGNNGTVKIDTVEVDDHNDPNIANRPHVGCTFKVRFFGFDKDQTAKITFDIHPPSGTSDVPLYSKTETVSDDAAAGGMNDEDAVFTYSVADDFKDLSKYKEHEKQGYHVKLTIESEGVPGGVKHKVFWVPNCQTPTTPTTPPGSPTTTPPTESTAPGGSVSPGAGGNGGGEEGGLPLTGVAGTSIALTGLALIAGGAGLVWLRRRRDNITFTS
ncbi:LPXTG-motif cell wall anchor domain-containing protein [Micromonospora rhizosphaerae]|uniref:LPXTG-motif cell wall anchor domain-containing protein n=1 Tax=Micromonospora rhizosphaerae TaxID=568872 RepID=A0A1C6RZ70_9ACTN|nr:LPXTG cell wall anchor domain-containing protein [Micromonospora rhizosphaerae]SCL22509.1 LPXTG-motif cell wall anchor domain-containing protein [Micromonospora rhizosphaerae]